MTESRPTSSLHEVLPMILGASGDPADRARARSEICADVLRNLGAYVPHPFPNEPSEVLGLRGLDGEEIRKLIRPSKETQHIFGTWRAQVTNVEAANAGRLSVLGSTVITLIELRKWFDPDDIERAVDMLRDWVRQVWRVEVPAEAHQLRGWATRATLNLTYLPPAWRGLSC